MDSDIFFISERYQLSGQLSTADQLRYAPLVNVFCSARWQYIVPKQTTRGQVVLIEPSPGVCSTFSSDPI